MDDDSRESVRRVLATIGTVFVVTMMVWVVVKAMDGKLHLSCTTHVPDPYCHHGATLEVLDGAAVCSCLPDEGDAR